MCATCVTSASAYVVPALAGLKVSAIRRHRRRLEQAPPPRPERIMGPARG